MRTLRSITAGMARMVLGLLALELSLEVVTSPTMREQLSGSQITREARALAEGVLRDVETVRRGDWL